ncbi:hypothetical protein CTAYLR_005141 [Chrysophaeum taylorii]|uniref:RNA helicase n=1 Tax=Chrysophaeum taylorii TaxID=2483200 RepID=A0AAD7UFX9_9STRA|nr:hypothetical protein CTAYLR_005141 [Chrysophaeum taylorii]
MGEGCEDATFLGLEEVPGSEYAATSGGTKKRKKEAKAPERTKKTKEARCDDSEIAAAWCGECHLHPTLLAGLCKHKFASPMEIQRAVLPLAMVRGRDVLCASPTGSGKTLAFALPALHDALEQEASGLRTLVVAPTRELALQVASRARSLLPEASATKLSAVVACVTGGLSEHKQRRVLARKPPILVATPGRLRDLQEDVDCSELRYLVVDEADRMLQAGAFPDLRAFCDRSLSKGRWQTLVFSATLSLAVEEKPTNLDGGSSGGGDDDLRALVDPLRSGTRKLEIVDKTLALPETLSLEVATVADNAAKLATLYAVLRARRRGATIVFVNAVATARRLCAALEALEVPAAALHASMPQKKRLSALDKLRSNESRAVLVATDVAARGLDARDVDLVVHYDVAPTFKLFVHRAGRTARAGDAGLSLVLVSPQDAKRHEAHADVLPPGALSKRLRLDPKILETALRRARLALDVAQLQDAERREAAATNWLSRFAGRDDETSPPAKKQKKKASKAAVDDDDGGDVKKRKKKELAALVAEPLATKPKRKFVVVTGAMVGRPS